MTPSYTPHWISQLVQLDSMYLFVPCMFNMDVCFAHKPNKGSDMAYILNGSMAWWKCLPNRSNWNLSRCKLSSILLGISLCIAHIRNMSPVSVYLWKWLKYKENCQRCVCVYAPVTLLTGAFIPWYGLFLMFYYPLSFTPSFTVLEQKSGKCPFTTRHQLNSIAFIRWMRSCLDTTHADLP